MKDWTFDEAINQVETILLEEIPEQAMTDDECKKLAKKIVTRLENADHE